MPATIIPRASELLWKDAEATGRLAAYDELPTVSLTTKAFDVPFDTVQRNNTQRQRIGYNTDSSKKLNWLYEEQIKNLIIGVLGKSAPNGLHSLSNGELDTIAAAIAAISGEFIIADYEPHNNNYIPYDTIGDDWVWVSFEHPAKINYISQKVKDLTTSGTFFKKFLDWFQRKNFTFNGKQLGLATSKGVWQNNSGTVTVNDYLDYFANPSAATNFDDQSSITKLGWGYTNITYKVDNMGGATLPANSHFAPIASYLFSLSSINRVLAHDPNKNILYILWPREDEGPERQQYRQVRFKPKSLDGSINPTGYLRASDSRLTYPSNLVQDNTFVACCNPKVTRIHAWILPSSENPHDALRYAKRNGVDACNSAVLGFELSNYVGSDNPPCPTSGIDYYGEEALGFNAIMAGINRFAQHQDILDGTQTGSSPIFDYKRDYVEGVDQDGDFTNVAAVADLSEFDRSWKFRRPWIKVWLNPTSGKRLVLFQDPFAEAFEPVAFKVTIASVVYRYTAEGNGVFSFRID